MNEKKRCPACKKDVFLDEEICSNCEFPFKGTEKEKSIHIGRFINQRGVLVDSDNSIGRTKNILFIVSAFLILNLIISLYKGYNDIFTIGFYVLLSLTFIVSGVLIKKSPLLFTIFPLTLLIGFYFIQYLVNPMSVFSGIFIKIIIVGSMIYSIYLINKSNKFRKKYDFQD